MSFCELCGFSAESETHREPFGKPYAGVFITHPFEPDNPV